MLSTVGMGATGAELIESLLTKEVIALITGDFIQMFTGAYPLPMIDVGEMIPAATSGTEVTFSPDTATMSGGYFVLGGHLLSL